MRKLTIHGIVPVVVTSTGKVFEGNVLVHDLSEESGTFDNSISNADLVDLLETILWYDFLDSDPSAYTPPAPSARPFIDELIGKVTSREAMLGYAIAAFDVLLMIVW